MPPRAKRRPPSPASPMDNPTDAMEAAVRLVEELSGQEGQEDQNSPLLNFLLPPSRPRILLPTPTTPPRRRSNKRTSTPTSSSSLSARSSPSPPALIRNSDHKRAADPDQFPHQYRRLPDGSYSLVECWELHGRSRCTTGHQPNSRALDTHPTTSVLPTPNAGTTRTSSSSTTSATSPPPASTLDMGSLPKGWEPKTPRSQLYPIPAIVVCSFILAAVIAGIIVLCAIMRRRQKETINAADTEGDQRRTAGSDDDGAEGNDRARVRGQVTGHHIVSASSISVLVKPSKVRWRGRFLPSSLRLRRKRRKTTPASVISPQTSRAHPRAAEQYPLNDVDESSDDDSEVASNAEHPRPGSCMSSRSRRQAVGPPAPAEDGTSIVNPPTSSPSYDIPPADSHTSSVGSSRRPSVRERDRTRTSAMPFDDGCGDDLPAYPRRDPASYPRTPPPQSHDPSVPREFAAVGNRGAAEDCMTEGHLATDEKPALERLGRLPSEPAVDPSPSPSLRAEMPSTADDLTHMGASAPNEEDITLHEVASVMDTPGLGSLHASRANPSNGVNSSVATLMNSGPNTALGAAHPKPSNDPLPAHISHTARTPAQSDEDDEVPPYEAPRARLAANILPEPVVHEATAREYERLAAGASASTTLALLGFTASALSGETLPTPSRDTGEVDEELGPPSAPPLEDLDEDEGGNDDTVYASAPPLEAFVENDDDSAAALGPSAPPAWD